MFEGYKVTVAVARKGLRLLCLEASSDTRREPKPRQFETPKEILTSLERIFAVL